MPTKVDPDFTELPEAHYSENGVRYLHALFISEPGDTPDVTGVTFIIARLVTVRYHPVGTFDLFSQKLCKAPAQVLSPDVVALGLINTSLNRMARALSKGGENLDRVASAVFRAEGDQSEHNQVYSEIRTSVPKAKFCSMGRTFSRRSRISIFCGRASAWFSRNRRPSRCRFSKISHSEFGFTKSWPNPSWKAELKCCCAARLCGMK